MKKIAFLLACALLAGVSASGSGPAALRVTARTLDVRFEPSAHRITATAVLTVGPGAAPLRFRLHSGLAVTSVELLRGDEVFPLAVARDETEGYWRTVETAPLPGGGERRVRVRYGGTLYDAVRKDEKLSFVVGDDTRGVVGEEGIFLVAGSGWYPVTEGTGVFREVRVDVPGDLRAVTQGERVSRRVEGGREITVWRSDVPVDGLALQAGKYVVETRTVDGVSVSTYLFPGDAKHAKLLLDETERYLRFYVPLLGPYPWPKFDIVENFFTTGYGMPSYTLLGRRVVGLMAMMAARNGGSIPPGFVDHELVHCWWGNYVYPDYETGNWCEGLTSYCSNYLRKEIADPLKARAHREKTCRTFSIQVNPGNDYPVREFRGKHEDFENDIGYGKASMIFHMLRRMVGDDVFWSTLRGVVRDHGGKVTSWDDFRDAFSKAAGRDLGWFFRQWLDRKGAPVLAAGPFTVTRRPDGLFLVRGTVLQTGKPWRLDVPVTVEHAGGESYRTVPVSEASTSFEIVCPRPPLSVTVDKRHNLFRRIPLEELQPCLNLTLSRPDKVYVVPEGISAYRRLAERAKAQKGGEITAPGKGLPEKDCLVFGRPSENPATAAALKAAGVRVEGDAVILRGRKFEGKDLWLLLSIRHPTAKGRYVTVFFGTTPAALARARVIFHYGWDGRLVYADGHPLARGDFTATSHRNVRLFDLPVDQAAIRTTLAALAGIPRKAGTPGGAKARAWLAKRLEALGEVREIPFSFEVRDFTDRDAWSVDQGFLEDGKTPWRTSYPGAVVPAVFSAEAPEGIRIGKFVKYGAPAEAIDGETIVLLPEVESPEDLFLLLTEIADSGAAAAAVPKSCLSHRALAELAVYPSLPGRRLRDGEDPWLFASGVQSRGPRPRVTVPFPVVFFDDRILPPGGEGDANAVLRVRFTKREIRSANLLVTIPDASGSGERAAVGLSAHYDSLGEGFPGADDNASGVAAVLAAARALAARRDLLGRPVTVILTGAEEWGLRGSRALAPALAGKLVADVNLDTVGARDVREIYVIGRSVRPDLSARAAACFGAEGFPLGKDIDRFAFRFGSDHWSFHRAGIPSLDLFSSSHRRMNSAADTLDLVDPAKTARVARAAARLVLDLAAEPAEEGGNVPERPKPAKAPRETGRAGKPPPFPGG